jgi:serine/threonine protein kinase
MWNSNWIPSQRLSFRSVCTAPRTCTSSPTVCRWIYSSSWANIKSESTTTLLVSSLEVYSSSHPHRGILFTVDTARASICFCRFNTFDACCIVCGDVELLDGMAFMHSKNICHRDLKPENVSKVFFVLATVLILLSHFLYRCVGVVAYVGYDANGLGCLWIQVLIAVTKNDIQVKICDFGLSAALPEGSTLLSEFSGSPGA